MTHTSYDTTTALQKLITAGAWHLAHQLKEAQAQGNTEALRVLCGKAERIGSN